MVRCVHSLVVLYVVVCIGKGVVVSQGKSETKLGVCVCVIGYIVVFGCWELGILCYWWFQSIAGLLLLSQDCHYSVHSCYSWVN